MRIKNSVILRLSFKFYNDNLPSHFYNRNLVSYLCNGEYEDGRYLVYSSWETSIKFMEGGVLIAVNIPQKLVLQLREKLRVQYGETIMLYFVCCTMRFNYRPYLTLWRRHRVCYKLFQRNIHEMENVRESLYNKKGHTQFKLKSLYNNYSKIICISIYEFVCSDGFGASIWQHCITHFRFQYI